MSTRRMFSDEISNSDAFLDMPKGSQLLYFHLGLHADDDGFIANPKMVMRVIGASEDEYKILLVKKFVLTFETGICVIKHWRINNYIRKDIYKETKYKREKATLYIRENGAYTFTEKGAKPLPSGHFAVERIKCDESVHVPSTQRARDVHIDKVRLDKVSIGKSLVAVATAATPKVTKVPKTPKPKKEIVTYTKESLELVLDEMEKTPHLDLIATYIREKPVTVENSQQLNLIITRFCKVASDMVGAYTNEQVFKAIDKIKKDNVWRKRKGEEEIDWTMETLLKTLVKN